jgi:hypothetical protein
MRAQPKKPSHPCRAGLRRKQPSASSAPAKAEVASRGASSKSGCERRKASTCAAVARRSRRSAAGGRREALCGAAGPRGRIRVERAVGPAAAGAVAAGGLVVVLCSEQTARRVDQCAGRADEPRRASEDRSLHRGPGGGRRLVVVWWSRAVVRLWLSRAVVLG